MNAQAMHNHQQVDCDDYRAGYETTAPSPEPLEAAVFAYHELRIRKDCRRVAGESANARRLPASSRWKESECAGAVVRALPPSASAEDAK